jgi:hypothetical protein
MHIELIIVLCFIGSALLYLLFLIIESKLEVKSSPREPMYECPKHGLFRAKHLIEFMKNEETGEPHKWCPMCINEKIKVPLDSTVIS